MVVIDRTGPIVDPSLDDRIGVVEADRKILRSQVIIRMALR